MTGTVADVNAAMNGMLFRPTAQAAQLQVVVNDLGHSGAGGPKTASGTVGITQILIPLPPSPPVVNPPVPGPLPIVPPPPPVPATPAVVPAGPVSPHCSAPPGTEAADYATASAHARGEDLLERVAAAEWAGSADRRFPVSGGRLNGSARESARLRQAAQQQLVASGQGGSGATSPRAVRCGTTSTPWTKS